MELLAFIVVMACVIAFLFKRKPKNRIPGYVYGVDQASDATIAPLQKKEIQQYPYKIRGALFSEAERSFFGVLSQAITNKETIFGKVRIADILEPSKGLSKSNWQTAFNQISRKHFDYVLCRPDDLSVISVIELDDKSHLAPKQIRRDQLVEMACSSAGLIIHRFKARGSYSIQDIRDRIYCDSNLKSNETKTSMLSTHHH